MRSTAQDPVSFAIDVSPDRSHASIGVAGERSDGLAHIETVQRAAGTSWVVPRIVELNKTWEPRAVALDAGGPAGSLVIELERHGITVTTLGARNVAQACGAFYDVYGSPVSVSLK